MGDVLGLVTQARAAMLMRGYEPLRLHCGPAFWRMLCRCDPNLAHAEMGFGQDIAEVLDMLVSVSLDMEGFAVLPA